MCSWRNHASWHAVSCNQQVICVCAVNETRRHVSLDCGANAQPAGAQFNGLTRSVAQQCTVYVHETMDNPEGSMPTILAQFTVRFVDAKVRLWPIWFQPKPTGQMLPVSLLRVLSGCLAAAECHVADWALRGLS